MNNSPQLQFTMCAGIRFNRPLTSEDFISPGGYEMTMNGKNIRFDFSTYGGSINKDDNTVADFLMSFPDFDTFEDLQILSADDLKNITSIEEFFVFTGEPGETDLYATGLEYLEFSIYTPEEDITIFIPQEVLESAEVTGNIQPPVLQK